jgi:putative ABC transport system permease protein
MLQNYFTIALRNILKHKFYSVLNIVGLAFGLTSCFLIGLYIYDELTFDKFHKDYQNIYRAGIHLNFGGQEIKSSSSCPPLASAMMTSIPGVAQATRINPWPLRNVVVKNKDKAFTETKAMLADSNFFQFFSFKLLQGDVKTALKEPYSAVLTEATAAKYFNNETAIGKTITVGQKNEAYTITGIAAQAPSNSHIQYDILLSASSNDEMKHGGWGDLNGVYTYYRKSPNTTIESIQVKLRQLVVKNVGPELENYFGEGFADFEKAGGVFTFITFPLSDHHLFRPDVEDGASPPSDVRYVYIMGAVGLFILIIACINFMNLSTARSASRAKEVGLRKTLGSVRSRLVVQFLSESFLYVFAAMIIAIAGVYLLLPAFNLLSGKALSFSTMLSPTILSAIATIFVVVALLAGSYPAFYLTAFNPIDVLKGKVRSGMKSKGIRSTLVVVQFSISIVLIICTMVVYWQLSFMQEKNIGLDKQNVLLLQNTERMGMNQDAFMEALNNQAGIVKASYINDVFPGVNAAGTFRKAGTTKDIMFPVYSADYNHLEVLKIELAQGRFFSKDFPSDSLAVVLNEAAVKELGWTDAVNEQLTTDATGPVFNVIGVVKDFNFESLKTKVRPLVIFLRERSNYMLIRYSSNANDAVTSIETLWKKYSNNEPYEYTFLDQNFDKLFREEQRLGNLFTVMSGIAIFIACMGLLGLASFTAEQRTKEIGIRKVMGATVSSVNTLLSKEFMVLVAIAFFIACGLSWYAMDEWLKSFAYRITLGPLVFVLGGLIAASVAWLTVSYHFFKAARANPSEALRHE